MNISLKKFVTRLALHIRPIEKQWGRVAADTHSGAVQSANQLFF